DRFHNDFTFYLAAARIGLAHGWPNIYDLNLQQAELDALGSGIKIAELARYISPPPVAWAAVPLTPLPYVVAYGAWSILLLGAMRLKPQLAFLAPLALLAARRDKAAVGSVIGLGALAGASAFALGPAGIAAYRDLLSFAAGVPVNRELTLAYFAGDLNVTRA